MGYIKREGDMAVTIVSAMFTPVETKDKGEIMTAYLEFKDANADLGDMTLWLSDDVEQYGEYKGMPQFEASLAKLEAMGMTDGDPDNVGDLVNKEIAVYAKIKDGNEYPRFYPSNKAPKVEADIDTVKARILKMRGQTKAMAGTPVDSLPDNAQEGDKDSLPF